MNRAVLLRDAGRPAERQEKCNRLKQRCNAAPGALHNPRQEVLEMFDPHTDPIHSYSRKQAIEDGALVDASQLAREAGFRIPVALTRAAWERTVTVPKNVVCQDETGRLWDVLTVLYATIRRADGGAELIFAVHVRNSNRPGIPPVVYLKAL